MRIENITLPVSASVFKSTVEENDKILERRANKTAAVLLSLSGLATLGLVGVGIMHDKKLALKGFDEVVKNKGIVFDKEIATLKGEAFSGRLKYLSKNNLVKTRVYKNGLLDSLTTERRYGDSTKLLLERDNEGKIKSFVLRKLSLWHRPSIIHTKKLNPSR